MSGCRLSSVLEPECLGGVALLGGRVTCGAEYPLMDFIAASAWVIYLIVRQSKSSRPAESLFFNF